MSRASAARPQPSSSRTPMENGANTADNVVRTKILLLGMRRWVYAFLRPPERPPVYLCPHPMQERENIHQRRPFRRYPAARNLLPRCYQPYRKAPFRVRLSCSHSTHIFLGPLAILPPLQHYHTSRNMGLPRRHCLGRSRHHPIRCNDIRY